MMGVDLDEIPARWRVTLSEFTIFLSSVKRSSACPLCPHDGDWNFYIDNDVVSGPESFMMITILGAVAPQSHPNKQEPHAAFTMECPNCGHLVLTNAETVAKVLSLEASKNG